MNVSWPTYSELYQSRRKHNPEKSRRKQIPKVIKDIFFVVAKITKLFPSIVFCTPRDSFSIRSQKTKYTKTIKNIKIVYQLNQGKVKIMSLYTEKRTLYVCTVKFKYQIHYPDLNPDTNSARISTHDFFQFFHVHPIEYMSKSYIK